ncbi:PxKF domain-containing protein [Candidatus Curtissbacteria bacterium]|nr:PxKF domain-containing protein [Candidatus Curtissbacteria bacterium]
MVNEVPSGTVQVVDGNTNAIIKTISVGNVPGRLALNSVTKRLYVTNGYGDDVSVIDTVTHTIIATIPVGDFPSDVAVDQLRNRIYVVNNLSNTLTVIDGASNSVTATIPLGSTPWGVAVDEDANRVFVSNRGDNSVSVVDAATNTVAHAIPVGREPLGVATNPNTGRIYAANSADDTVSVIEDSCLAPPPPDSDNDGIPDSEDACPNEPEDKNGFKDDDGCPEANLTVDIVDAPDPVTAGDQILYTIYVDNIGNAVANDVELQNFLPPEVSFLSAEVISLTPGPHPCSYNNLGLVICSLGTIAPKTAAAVDIRVKANFTSVEKTITSWVNSVRTSSEESDPFNSAKETTLVQPKVFDTPRKIIFVDGIGSSGDGVKSATQALREYLKSNQELRESIGLKETDLILFSYSGNYGLDALGNKDFTQPLYERSHTCGGITEAAGQLDDLLRELINKDAQVQFDILTHSMGGMVAAYWVATDNAIPDPVEPNRRIIERAHSVVTFDSPLHGAPLSTFLNDVLYSQFFTECAHTDSSVLDLGEDSGVVKTIQNAASFVPFYTMGALQFPSIEGIPLNTTLPGEIAHLTVVEDDHSTIWNDLTPATKKLFVLCAIKGSNDCINPVSAQHDIVQQGQSKEYILFLPADALKVGMFYHWGGSTIDTYMTAPDGSIISPSSASNSIRHEKGEDYEYYEIDNPQSGSWTLHVFGRDIPPEGEQLTIQVGITIPSIIPAAVSAIPDFGAVGLNWTQPHPSFVNFYRVYRKIGDGAFEKVGEATTNLFSDTSAVVGAVNTYAVSAVSIYDNESELSDPVSVTTFGFGGFLPPLTANQKPVFKLNSTIPVKFELSDSLGNPVTSAQAKLVLQKLSDGIPSGAPVDATPTGGANTGNMFKVIDSRYSFNLDTKPLSFGTWQIKVLVNDGANHSIEIGLK